MWCIFKEKSNYPNFCISGWLAVKIDADKWDSTALECGIDAEAGEDDSPLVGFYKHCTGIEDFLYNAARFC